jgi:hypothetical protein
MRLSRRSALIAAAVLIAVAIAVAALRAGDEESPDASPAATTSNTITTSSATTTVPATTDAATTEAATTEAATTSATTGVTEPEDPAATTEEAQTDTSGPAVTTPPPPRAYALGPTRRCLEDAGFAVSKVRSADPRLRALGDLAQRTSLEARRDGKTLGLAFGDTRLLASLLRVPNDPYRLEVRRNAVLMYRPSARDAATLLRGCLRS